VRLAEVRACSDQVVKAASRWRLAGTVRHREDRGRTRGASGRDLRLGVDAGVQGGDATIRFVVQDTPNEIAVAMSASFMHLGCAGLGQGHRSGCDLGWRGRHRVRPEPLGRRDPDSPSGEPRHASHSVCVGSRCWPVFSRTKAPPERVRFSRFGPAIRPPSSDSAAPPGSRNPARYEGIGGPANRVLNVLSLILKAATRPRPGLRL